MRPALIAALLGLPVLLAACGAEAPPVRPTASAGVSIGSGGVAAGGRIGASNGIVSVGIGV